MEEFCVHILGIACCVCRKDYYTIMCYADAARRFFQLKCDEEALKDKGKYGLKVTLQRRRNRILRVSCYCCI